MTTAKPLNILIVEDEAILAMELEGIIEDSGHTVSGWAINARQAISEIENSEVDVVFLDIHLGKGPSGVEVAEHIQENSKTTVVFLTANPKRIPDHFSGAAGVIGKPYTVNGVTEALRYLAEGVRKPPPDVRRPSAFQLSPKYAEAWASAA